MFHNVGKIDRMVRFILGILLVILYFTKAVEGDWATATIILALVLLMTSFRQCCPIYALLGFGTCGVKTEKTENFIKTDKLKL